jgi:hypothetical protein
MRILAMVHELDDRVAGLDRGARSLTIGNAGCRRFSSCAVRRSSGEYDAIPRKGHYGGAENDDV